jgi:hypothetical protein
LPPKIQSNGYNIEIFQGPLIAPIHVTGVGGAYVALAEGTEGSAANAAAPAVRTLYSTTWFDWDLAVGISFPGAFTTTDFDNHGDDPNLPPNHADTGNYTDLNLGTTVQVGDLGVSAVGDLQQYSVTTTTSGQPGLTLQIGRWKALAAYGFFDGQLAIGGGARIVTMQILQNNNGSLLTMTGASPEVGALLMPTGQAWRLGATARAPVSGSTGVNLLGQSILGGTDNSTACSPTSGARCVGGFYVPSRVVMPWEVEVGVAYQLGPRPLNPGWENPRHQEARLRAEIASDRAERQRLHQEELARLSPGERPARRAEIAAEEKSLRAIEDDHLAEESARLNRARKARYANWPREKILLLASVLMTGQSSNAVSIEGFLDKLQETVGQQISLTPRLGLEGEPIRDRMVLRTGTYVEPSRYEGGSARQHYTFGSDIRLFSFDAWGLLPAHTTWKLGLFADLAPRYTNWGFGISNWH